MSVVLRLNNLQAAYGKVQVLWGIDLHLQDGEFVTVVGSNGAGKTTMLRTISSLIQATAGTVELFGQNITNAPSSQIVQAGLAHVPEGRQLFPLMSVADNLELGASAKSSAWAARESTRREMYDLFPRLEERKTQLAGTLSGGEQQMLAVARALMALPKIMLVDEPSLGLSPKLTQIVFAALEAVSKRGVAVLLVEQNVRQSLRLANRAYVLENGKVTLEGTGTALLEDERVQKAYLAL
jgi:branched-chain amino acid transport system ATP-binding protein